MIAAPHDRVVLLKVSIVNRWMGGICKFDFDYVSEVMG